MWWLIASVTHSERKLMRAIILAAGRGERMRPLTDATPKPLLKVAGKCLIDYHLEKLARAGFREVVINISWLAEQIVAHVGDGAQFGLHIHWSYEAVPLETGGGMATAMHLLGDEPFAMICADVFSEFDYALFPQWSEALRAMPAAKLLLVPRQTDLVGEYRLLEDGKLQRAAKGDAIERTFTWASMGVFHPQLFAPLRKNEAFKLMPHFLAWMGAGQMQGELYNGLWDNLGNPRQLDELNIKMAITLNCSHVTSAP
jgi:N-acetyl-alpha-D-muramate 1-phosphate uridylyltransferase